MTLRVLLRVLGTDQPAFDQPPDIGVVASQTQNAGIAHEIETAVTDMGKIKLPAAENQSRTSCTHSLKYGVLLGETQNASMGSNEGLDQQIGRASCRERV